MFTLWEAHRRCFIDMLGELDASLSSKQRQTVLRKLGSIAEDVEELGRAPSN